MLIEAIIILSAVFLALGSIADLKTGEVPEAHSMGLIYFIALVSIVTACYYLDFTYVLLPFAMGAASFVIAYLIYWLGQWGGGDVKILAGIGGLLGYLDASGFVWPNRTFLDYQLGYLLPAYMLNMAVIATPYALAYTLVMGFSRPEVFSHYLRRLSQPISLLCLGISIMPLVVCLFTGIDPMFSLAYALIPIMVLITYYMKTVEDKLMTRRIKVSQLKDWDILAEDVKDGDVMVASAGVIEGVTPEQLVKIKQLAAEGKISDSISTKWGVKFVPVLFISLPLTLYCGNVLEILFLWLVKSH